MTRPTNGLTAVTRPAGTDVAAPHDGADALAFTSPRRGVWGTGIALRVDLPAPWPDHVGMVASALSEIGCDGDSRFDEEAGAGPVAFGALPFDRARPATLVVPRVLHGRTAEGRRWTTRIDVVGAASGTGEDVVTEPATQGRPTQPTEVSIRSVRTPEDWCAAVSRATERIGDGELTKVVLARELALTFDVAVDPTVLYRHLAAAYPSAMTFCVEGFVGATPELLVSRVGDIVRAQPMAGTMPRTGDPDADQRRAGELLGSTKNREEHQITIDMVHDRLLPWCSFLDAEPQPSVVAAGPVQHLATMVEGRLSSPAPSVLELVAALHPTPAVGGWPTDAALEVIAELEGADRGRYAGPVGWVDAQGNGAFGVGIRSVQFDRTEGRMFAGVGVVADSDPSSELEETRAKAQALLGPLCRL